MKPRQLLVALVTVSFLLAPLAALQAGDESPIVGAIRWDGWYGDGIVTKAVEASLGQAEVSFSPAVVRAVAERWLGADQRRFSGHHGAGARLCRGRTVELLGRRGLLG